MARRKISRKMPPLRQIQGIFEQGINNYDQANIDQNAAASFSIISLTCLGSLLRNKLLFL